MRKITTIILCLLLVGMMVVPAMAAQSAYMSVTTNKSTVSRGDTITVTVRASAVEHCTSGGIMFSFDKNVFDYVSGSSLSGLNGYTAGVSTTAGNIAGYFMNGDTTVKDDIFQIVLKVKETAAFGTYTITGTPSLTAADGAVSCGIEIAYVTVACNHSYSAWSDAGNGSHSRSCSACSYVESSGHSWDNGMVVKAATCQDTGMKRYTCTVCNATKTETIGTTNAHAYGNWAKVDDATHAHTCSICAEKETAPHSWDGGTVTKAANCKETGTVMFTCTACHAVKTENIAQLSVHTYDHDCDADCNVCGAMRSATHNYKNAWSSNSENHWHECSVCHDKKDIAAHCAGAEPTETTAQTCTVCGYMIRAALGHKHSYADILSTDKNGHWYKCSGCEEKGSYTVHDFNNSCDIDCSICGYTRETVHTPAEELCCDANTHWYICTVCGLELGHASHEADAEATETTPQMCSLCGYEMAPALGVESTIAPTESAPVTITEISVEETDNGSNDFSWQIAIAAAVVTAVSVAILIAVKKRKCGYK